MGAYSTCDILKPSFTASEKSTAELFFIMEQSVYAA